MPYIGKSPTGTGVRSRYYFTATAGATSLSGADDNSNTLVFSDGNYVDVSLNGIALVAGTDYNTTTANTIAGLSALSGGDIVEVVVYDIFTVADTVSAKNGGTFSGPITATSFTGDGSGLTGVSAGKVLQVKSTTETAVVSFVSTTTNTFVDIPNMSVTITPTATSSKILVFFTANVGQTTTATIHVRLVRGSTPIYVGDSGGSRLQDSAILRSASSPYTLEIGNLQGTFLDSPATTSATVYKLQGVLGASYDGTFYLNSSGGDSDADFCGRTASSITVMEIEG